MSRKLPGSAIVPGTITVTQITGGLNDTTNASYAQANTARTTANDAYGQANTARDQANTARTQANTAYGQANNAYSSANLAYDQANASYNVANTKLASAGGTLSGDLIITGNLTVSGNSTTLNTEVLTVEDAEVILLSNVASTPALNAGVIVNRGTSTNTFLRWDEATDKWGWSDSGTTTYYFDDLRAGLATTNTTFGTINTSLGTINTSYQAAYAQANTAGTNALNAYGQANAAYGAANNRVLKAGDTMTGQLNISAGGLLVTGDVGLGTSNPGSKLHILDSSGPVLRMVRTSNRFDIEADNNAMGLVSRDSGTASAYFSGFSGVGIGTTQPAALLHVGSASSAAELLRLHVSYDTSRNIRGGITWHDGANVTGRIATEYDGSMVSMRFTSLYSGGYNSNDLMIIRGNGNVGIGTASPSANLHVQTSSNRHILIKSASHSTLSTDIGSAITFSRPSDGSADMAGIFSWNNGGLVFSSRNEIVFATGGTSSYSNAIEAMRITRSDSSPGNVGIGTSNPNAKLHVFGGTFTFEPAAGRYIYSNVDGSGHFIEQIGTTAAERILRIQNSNGGGTYTQLFLDGANQRIYTSTNVNVGIGTAAPDQKLRVVAASATSNADVINLDGGSTDFSGPNDANTAYSLIFNACAYSISSGVVQRTGASVTMAKETSWNEAVAGAGTKGALVFKTNSGTIASPSLLERMRISSGGIVTTPYQPSFSAYLNTGYTHPSGVVGAIGGTWATHHNTGSHYSTSTRRFTAPIAGTYQFHCIIATEGGSGSFNYLSAELWVNGNRTRIGGWGCGGAGGSYGETASSYVVYMNAGDYAEMGCESNKSFNAQTGSNTLFAGYLIG